MLLVPQMGYFLCLSMHLTPWRANAVFVKPSKDNSPFFHVPILPLSPHLHLVLEYPFWFEFFNE